MNHWKSKASFFNPEETQATPPGLQCGLFQSALLLRAPWLIFAPRRLVFSWAMDGRLTSALSHHHQYPGIPLGTGPRIAHASFLVSRGASGRILTAAGDSDGEVCDLRFASSDLLRNRHHGASVFPNRIRDILTSTLTKESHDSTRVYAKCDTGSRNLVMGVRVRSGPAK
jgi:hypothetical protein